MKSKKKIKKLIKNPIALLLSFLAVIVISVIGSFFTDTSGWYESVKPSITPPNFVFPIVWTTLFMLMAVAIYFAYVNATKTQKQKVIIWFAVNLILNVLWSFLFFGMHLPKLAFINLLLLWLSILIIINLCWKISKISSWLLVPYLLWVSFAGILNYLIAF